MRAATDHLKDIVAERHSAVKQSYDALMSQLAATNEDGVRQKNAELLHNLNSLGEVVARAHWPGWLADLIQHANGYDKNYNNGHATWLAHLKSLFRNFTAVHEHEWFFEAEDAPPFNIDEIIENAKVKYSVDEHYRRVIETLEVLVQSDDLDSIKAIRDLESIVSLLRASQKGSYYSQVTAWTIGSRFMANFGEAYLKKSKILGPAIDAFEKTAQELDLSIKKTAEQAKHDVGKAIRESLASQAGALAASEGIAILETPDSSLRT